MLDWLWEYLSDDQQQEVRACLDLFAEPKPNRDDLTRAASAVEELEKRFATFNPEQTLPAVLQHSVLVCTVGMRPMPVILTALLSQPVRLYLLHTADSRKVAETIRDDPFIQELGLNPVEDIRLSEISLTDAPKNYGNLREIVRENPQRTVVVDISGGVKVMGTSLAAAAFWLRLPVIYQLGHEVLGIVRPFSACLTLLQNPYIYFGSTELRSIQELFQSGDYDAALALARNLRESVGDVTTLGRLDILLELIDVYRDWDAFMHSVLKDTAERKLAARLRAVSAKMQRLNLHFMDIAQRESNIEFLQEIDNRWRQETRSMNDEYHLVDIYASALRRAAAGKYDDAVARLYRCLEMSASLLLAQECGVSDVRNPDLSSFTAKLGSEAAVQDAFRKVAKYDFPAGKALGLKDQMTLLFISGDARLQAVGGVYQGLESKDLMERRNRSILAHGTVSVARGDYDEFLARAREIVSRAVGDNATFQRMLAQATHPPISIEI